MSISIKKSIRVSVASVLALGSCIAAVGCSAEVGQETADVDAKSDALCSASKFYGSDTLAPVIVAPATAKSLVYAGTGSGNGENGLRGTGPCSPAKQLSAPMSRDLTGGCTAGTDVLTSKRIGRDAILALTATTNPETSITKTALQQAFCLLPAPPGGACVSPLTLNGRVYNTFYRRDDSSGTTDTLKTQLGCTALCSDANHITITTGVRPAPCVATDTDTQCIARLAQANTGAGGGQFVLGYAGLSARTILPTRAKELDVDFAIAPLPAAPVAPTDVNIRNGSYPLSRFLFVNYNATALAALDGSNNTLNEKRFLCENILGPSFASGTNGCTSIVGMTDRRVAFENSLVTPGDFLKCSTTGGVFNCGAGLCP